MMKGLVSVTMRTYNRAGTNLRSSIDAILNQTYKNIELIISDNASTDNTEKICRQYAKRDSRVKYFRQEKNIGGILNWNFLRTKITGEFCFHACDDDLWDQALIEKSVKKMEENLDIAVAGSNFIEFDDMGRKVSYNSKFFHPTEKDLYKRLKQYILFYESDMKVMFVYSGVWRSKIFENDFYKEYPFFWWDLQDMNLVFRGLSKGTFEFIDEALYFKRISNNSLETLEKKFFLKRLFNSFFYSRFLRMVSPFFWTRMKYILKIKELSLWQRIKLIWWNLFVMSRFFWSKKI